MRKVKKTQGRPKKNHRIKKFRITIADLRKRLTASTVAFKKRIKEIQHSERAKAVRDVIRTLSKKASAKIRALEAAEIKFEKKYTKTLKKNLPTLFNNVSTNKRSTRHTRKRRGRPAKK